MAIWTGTVAVTNGDATFVVDTGDALNQFNCTPDAMIVIDGVVYFVLSRTNTTSGELTRAYAGTTGTKAAEISPLNQTTTSVLTFSAAASRLAAQLEIFDKNSQGFFYTLIGATGDADPGAGNLAFDSIDFAALTEGDVMSIYLDNVDGNGRSVANLLDTLSAGTILVVRSLTSSSYVSLTLAGMVDGSGYRKSDATYIGHDGVLSAAEPVSVAYFRVGQGLEIDAQGNFAGRAAHDAEPAGFTYLSTNGDGSSGVATLYRKVTASSGDWSLGAVLQGPQGDQGDQGNQGIKGDAGVDGADGASAYDIAVAQGFVGSVSAWLASLEGADGADGTDGGDGADGTDPGILLSWDEGTGDTNLGAGKIWADATLDLATTLFVSKTNRAGDDIGNWLLDLDASDSGIKGQLVITRTGGNAQAVINITVDGVDDRTGYVAINIADHSGADGFLTNDAVSLQFTRTGDRGTNGDGAGDVIGPAGGVTANEFVLFDGTTGKVIKGSGHYYGDYPLKTNNGSDFASKRETKDNLSLRGTAIASATTTDLSSATGDFVHVTGTTTITGFGTAPAGVARKVTFDGALTLTYNATSMILPGAGNIVTAAGDSLIAVSEGAGNWRVISYVRASGKAVVAEVTLAGTETLTNKTLTTPILTLEQGASVAPTAEGRIAWDTDDDKIKVGTGSGTKTFSDDVALGFSGLLDAADARSAYSSPNLGTQTLSDTPFALTRGTTGSPDSRSEPLFALTKISSNAELDRQNITAAFFIEKRSSADGAHATALFAEATDYAGWDGTGANNFIEGARLHSVLVSGGAKGSAYGAILFGGAASGIDWTYLVGAEGDVANNYSDQPTAASFSKNKFAAAFVATARGSYKSDVGFATNPYNEVAFRTGFLVAEDSVDHTAFASRAATSIGLDLSLGSQSYSAIRFDNNIAIHARNAAGSGDLNLLYASTSDYLVLGNGAAGLQLHTSDMTAGTVRVVTMGAADSGGSGFRVLRVPNS